MTSLSLFQDCVPFGFHSSLHLSISELHYPLQLYLQNDPDEFDNLWEDPGMAAIKMDLVKRSFDASIVIGDPGPEKKGRY